LRRNTRLIIALVFAVVIAAVFWSQSRVPALNEKAQMGLRTNFSSIAFDIVLPVDDREPVTERIAKTTVNWLYTNWKGMTFGLLFAAAALTILGSVKHRSFKSPWLNTLSGMFVGAPLGVCVNCATPIAQGMYAAGARLETALATLVSSPTLNVIVLSMAFSLLPWEIALGNVIAVLLLLGTMPALVRRYSVALAERPAATADIPRFAGIKTPPRTAPEVENEGLFDALLIVLSGYSRNLLYILRLAVPLMLLAGFLGAVVIELAPFDQFSDISPTLPVLFATALLATFLPVPMAFNVIVVMTLLSKGMHPGIGAVLLFALSVYSIYPATVIAKFISPKLSVAMALTVVILATTLGLITNKVFDYKLGANQQAITAGLSQGHRQTFRDALEICTSLPDELQLRCFSNQIRQLSNILPYEQMCRSTPAAIDADSCQQLVELFAAQELALETASNDPCLALGTEVARNRCEQSFILQSALRNHDIGDCNRLGGQASVQNCRIQYINSSLLFNPDESVCKNLNGMEQSDCQMNARIYRIADTLDIEACGSLPTAAQSHCRWVTATAMVGRSNDTSGCRALAADGLRTRCEEHATAWQASRTAAFEPCSQIQTATLRTNCLLKVADQKIAAILTNYSLALSSGSTPSPVDENGTEATATVIAADVPQFSWDSTFESNDLNVSHVEYRPRKGVEESNMMFAKISARDIGISKSWDFHISDFFEPFIIGKGITSGDFNNDLWPDIVLASEHGALIYKNVGGQFQLLDIDQGQLGIMNLFLVALVDLDGDGIQDLFASAYGGENFILLNKSGDFAETELVHIEGNHRLTLSAGFADIDRDEDVDIVLGNWSSGVEKLFAAETSTNAILFREDGSYRAESMNDVKGETNSVLIADINDDDIPDLMFGNDRLVPDIYYKGTTNRQLIPMTRDDKVVPVTSMFTMSLDSADFNNDLKADLFSTDMTFARSSAKDYCQAIAEEDAKLRCSEILHAFSVFSTGSAAQCNELATPSDVHECFLALSVKAAKTLKDNQYCDNLPDQDDPLHSLCQYIAAPIPQEERINQDDYLPQTQRNVLLVSNDAGFTDQSVHFGVDSSFWSWNGKAADLDNDGWQDIYVGNGFHFGDSFYEVQPNILYRNTDGTGFESIAPRWGLDDRINTPSFTYLDFDLDGDTDIIATGVLSPPRVYVNQQDKNNSVTFLLEQPNENAFAIGAKVTIRYGDAENLSQRKEIKLSGGFMSFDNTAVHFGIGQHQSIDSFSVTWPDGHVTEHLTSIPANRFYRLQRK
jgi:uncharacterized membrane protein YraQ (UPF0718 family)